MATSELNREVLHWSDATWSAIDATVKVQADLIRTLRAVFKPADDPAMNPDHVPADQFDPDSMTIARGLTRPYFQIWVDFSLFDEQLTQQAESQQQNARKLAGLAAVQAAWAEELLFFQGENAEFPKAVRVQGVLGDKTWPGLWGLESAKKFASHKASSKTEASGNGERGQLMLLEAMASLASDGHPEPFVLFVGRDAQVQLNKLVPGTGKSTLELLSKSLSAVYQTPGLMRNQAILAHTGGPPAHTYQAQDVITAYYNQKTSGTRNPFKVFERVRFVVLDPSAFGRLEF